MASNIDPSLWLRDGAIAKSAVRSPNGENGVLELLAQPAKDEIEALQATVATLQAGASVDQTARDAAAAAQTTASGKVSRSGDTMTGQLNGITPTAAANLARKDYVDSGDAARLPLSGGTLTGQVSGITPTAAANLTRKDYVDAVGALGVKKAGDAITGTVTAPYPTAASQLATKQYADDSVLRPLAYYRLAGSSPVGAIVIPAPSDTNWTAVELTFTIANGLTVAGGVGLRAGITADGSSVVSSSTYIYSFLQQYIQSSTSTQNTGGLATTSSLFDGMLTLGAGSNGPIGTLSVTLTYQNFLFATWRGFSLSNGSGAIQVARFGGGSVDMGSNGRPRSFVLLNPSGGTISSYAVSAIRLA